MFCCGDENQDAEEYLIAEGQFDLKKLLSDDKNQFVGKITLYYEEKPTGHVNIRLKFY